MSLLKQSLSFKKMAFWITSLPTTVLVEKNKSHFQSLISAMRERDQASIKPRRFTNRIDSDTSDVEDSYCNKATEPVVNSRLSPPLKSQCNGFPQNFNEPEVILKTEDSNYIVEVYPESPDLSNVPNISVETQKTQRSENNCYTEPYVYVKNYASSSPENNNFYIQSKDSCFSTVAHSETQKCITKDKSLCEEDNSDASNESFSLLTNYNNSGKENENCGTSSGKASISQSQLVDPDFIVTDSEFNCANEDTEDIFVGHPKRKRCNSVENNDMPKRVLRKRTKK